MGPRPAGQRQGLSGRGLKVAGRRRDAVREPGRVRERSCSASDAHLRPRRRAVVADGALDRLGLAEAVLVGTRFAGRARRGGVLGAEGAGRAQLARLGTRRGWVVRTQRAGQREGLAGQGLVQAWRCAQASGSALDVAVLPRGAVVALLRAPVGGVERAPRARELDCLSGGILVVARRCREAQGSPLRIGIGAGPAGQASLGHGRGGVHTNRARDLTRLLEAILEEAWHCRCARGGTCGARIEPGPAWSTGCSTIFPRIVRALGARKRQRLPELALVAAEGRRRARG
mmetsp:Transcript_95944/g.311155  ORF Transcript_95944/g.311155 Transcript_95944/m.311155 type:complete len:287 (-) Transcript_95944:3211-4071(-)